MNTIDSQLSEVNKILRDSTAKINDINLSLNDYNPQITKLIQSKLSALDSESISKFNQAWVNVNPNTLSMLDELYWAFNYNSTISNSEWLLDKSISPGRWAVGYNYLYILYRILNEMHPKTILELGLGQSTKVIGQYATFFHLKNNGGLHIVVEQNKEWKNFYMVAHKQFCSNTEIIVLPVVQKEKDGFAYGLYDNFQQTILGLDVRFQLLSIDGPVRGKRFGREDILSIIPKCLDKDFVILFDDYTSIIQPVVVQVEKILMQHDIHFVSSLYSGYKHKKVYVIASESWKYLTSL